MMLFSSREDLIFCWRAVSWRAGRLELLWAGAFQGHPCSWASAPLGSLTLLQGLSRGVGLP